MRHLLREWGSLSPALQKRSLCIFLDFDGTLTPLMDTPDQAVIPLKTKEILSALAQLPRRKLAIVSGRAIADLKTRVGIPSIMYVGNHGLEIEGPKLKHKPLLPARTHARLLEIKEALENKLAGIPGVFVEDKGFSLSLHYRLASPADIPKIKALFHEALIVFLVKYKFMVKEGKKVLEVRPRGDWDKGKVVLWLLGRWTFGLKDGKPLPIYVGDDTTDEDAFRALKNKGITVVVGKTKDSLAEYYLRDYTEVTDFLRMIAEKT